MKEIPLLRAEEVKKYQKPPEGIKPHFVEHEERIYELSKAVERYIKYIGEGCLPKDKYMYYRSIVEWAKEIQGLAELEIKMDGGYV